MKKILFIGLFSALILACSSDSSEDNDEVTLLGKWYVYSHTYEGVEHADLTPEGCPDNYINFTEDMFTSNSYFSMGGGPCQLDPNERAYELNGMEIYLPSSDNTFEILSLTSDELILHATEPVNMDADPELEDVTMRYVRNLNNVPAGEITGLWLLYKSDYEGDITNYEINGTCAKETLEFHSNHTIEEWIYVDEDCINGVGGGVEEIWSLNGNGTYNIDTGKTVTISGNQMVVDADAVWGYKKYYTKAP